MNFTSAKLYLVTGDPINDFIKEEMLIALAQRSPEFITTRRVLIIAEIFTNLKEIHVEEIWMNLKTKHQISRDTVYKVINILVQRGLIQREKAKFGYTYKIADIEYIERMLGKNKPFVI